MEAKEVLTHVANLEKAVREKLPSSHLIDVLKSLKDGVVASEKLLRDTKVGMAVNKLRMNPDPAVSDLAKDIVGKWKQDVQKVKSLGQDKARSTVSPVASQTPITPPKPSGKKLPPKAKVDPSKRDKKTDGVNYSVTGDKTRDNCVGILYDGLCLDSDASADHILSLAQSLEAEVFANYKRKIDAMYKRRIQTLFLNLKNKKNPNLRKRVASGEISTARLATMESHEMASEERKKEDEALQKENMRTAMVAKAEKSISDQLQCGKCGKRRVSYTQAQTRSADEPMTTFCTCEYCGNMWKFS